MTTYYLDTSSLSEKFRNPVFKLENGRFRGKNTVIDDQKPGLWSARRSLRQAASVLVKCYAYESGTDWMRTLVQSPQPHRFAMVRLAGPELVAALFRKVRTGELFRAVVHHLVQDFKADWQRLYDILEINAAITDRAMALAEKHGLRGYDAVHLAAATLLHESRRASHLPDMLFLAADNDLLQAAAAEGLRTDNPNSYP